MAYTTIDNPELYFQCKTWAGNNSGSGQAITLDGDENMQPDLAWIKSTDNGHSHVIYDSVRTSPAKYFVKSDDTIAERTATIGSFDSDGVTFSDNDGFYNGSDNYVGWFWKESATAGFDILTYTGNATNRTISHNLSAVPQVVIVKRRDSATAWSSLHLNGVGSEYRMSLNDTAAKEDDATFWQDTDPTSSVFSLGTSSSTNVNTGTYVAYLFSEKQGFSKFGSFTGNGADDGSYVYLGFSPAWIMIKSASAGNSFTSWVIYDNKRKNFNQNDGDNSNPLYANKSAKEGERGNGSTDISGNACAIDFLSNGFKCRDNANEINTSGDKYVYMAFAEAPFVNSNGVPNNAR
tara:strand:- start:53 stop:1099 length:1047 start_codon:yes stop_codon:yes gene_type:complete